MSVTAVQSTPAVTANYVLGAAKTGANKVWGVVAPPLKGVGSAYLKIFGSPELKIPLIPDLFGKDFGFAGGISFKGENLMKYARSFWNNPKNLGQDVSGPFGSIYVSLGISLRPRSLATAALTALAAFSVIKGREWFDGAPVKPIKTV